MRSTARCRRQASRRDRRSRNWKLPKRSRRLDRCRLPRRRRRPRRDQRHRPRRRRHRRSRRRWAVSCRRRFAFASRNRGPLHGLRSRCARSICRRLRPPLRRLRRGNVRPFRSPHDRAPPQPLRRPRRHPASFARRPRHRHGRPCPHGRWLVPRPPRQRPRGPLLAARARCRRSLCVPPRRHGRRRPPRARLRDRRGRRPARAARRRASRLSHRFRPRLRRSRGRSRWRKA